MGSRTRSRVVILAPVVVAAMVAVTAVSAPAADHAVTFPSDPFPAPYSPASVGVAVGDTVTFAGDFGSHPLVWDGGGLATESSGTSHTYTFTQPGTFLFHCMVHPTSMTGSVQVTGAAPATPGSTSPATGQDGQAAPPSPGTGGGGGTSAGGPGGGPPAVDDGGRTPTPSSPPQGAGPARDTTGPRVGVPARTLAFRGNVASLIVRSDASGAATATVRRGATVLARGDGAVAADRGTALRLRLTAAGRRRLTGAARTTATLTVIVRPAAGAAGSTRVAVALRRR